MADLLAKYARARSGQDRHRRSRTRHARSTSANSTAIAIDIAAYLKSRGISKGSRVLLLSDENLEKLLIWLGVWRIGAVICPFNLEINEKQMVDADRGARSPR